MEALIVIPLICSIPVLLGFGLIYVGHRYAKKRCAKLESPTRWTYINSAGGYFAAGTFFISSGIVQFVRLVLAVFAGSNGY